MTGVTVTCLARVNFLQEMKVARDRGPLLFLPAAGQKNPLTGNEEIMSGPNGPLTFIRLYFLCNDPLLLRHE